MVVALNLKEEGMEVVNVLGAGNGKTQGVVRGGSQAAGKGSLGREVGRTWKGRMGSQSQGLGCW